MDVAVVMNERLASDFWRVSFSIFAELQREIVRRKWTPLDMFVGLY